MQAKAWRRHGAPSHMQEWEEKPTYCFLRDPGVILLGAKEVMMILWLLSFLYKYYVCVD